MLFRCFSALQIKELTLNLSGKTHRKKQKKELPLVLKQLLLISSVVFLLCGASTLRNIHSVSCNSDLPAPNSLCLSALLILLCVTHMSFKVAK